VGIHARKIKGRQEEMHNNRHRRRSNSIIKTIKCIDSEIKGELSDGSKRFAIKSPSLHSLPDGQTERVVNSAEETKREYKKE